MCVLWLAKVGGLFMLQFIPPAMVTGLGCVRVEFISLMNLLDEIHFLIFYF